jgi:hypothetical protein
MKWPPSICRYLSGNFLYPQSSPTSAILPHALLDRDTRGLRTHGGAPGEAPGRPQALVGLGRQDMVIRGEPIHNDKMAKDLAAAG